MENNMISPIFELEVRTAQQREWLATEMCMPCYRFKPIIFIDGDRWCALYGENLQDGVAGFGKSPDEAMNDFNRAWVEELKLGERINAPCKKCHLRPAANGFKYCKECLFEGVK